MGSEMCIRDRIDADINRAKEILSFISADKEVQNLVEAREKALLDRISQINGAREQGIQEGKVEAAISILDILDDKTIADKLGLDIEFVKQLRREHL